MPPKIDQTTVTGQQPVHNHQPVKKTVKPVPRPLPKVEAESDKTSAATRKSDLLNYGTQQKDRIERFYGSGAAAVSTSRDMSLAIATNKANSAYTRTYNSEKVSLASKGASSPKNLVEVAQRAESAYRTELKKSGFTPSDVRGTSVVKAADFMRSQAKVPGDFTTLSPQALKNQLAAGEQPKYFVRVMDKNYLSDPKSSFSGSKPTAWMATPQELAGAKLDGFEAMKRVGFSDSYINSLAAKGKKPSDFVLVVTEAQGMKGQQVPTWDNVIKNAKSNPDFAGFKRQANNPAFWDKVQTLDYKAHLEQKANLGIKDARTYAKTLPKSEQGAFLARDMMNSKLGVNEFFTGDGRTARTDGKNSGYGAREFLVNNDPIASTQRNTFIELGETGKTNLTATSKVPTISNNPLRLGSEMKTGAIGGAVVSTVTSLPQVFDQARSGDLLGAGKTLATNAGTGATVGAISSAGERIVGRGIENSLARSSSSLFAGAEGGVARQVAGRIGGAGVVGGLVSGGVAAYDQIGAYKRGEVTGSQAVGTVVGEAAVGVGAGMAGAAAGAAIGSIIPGLGTVVGGVVGFGVGVVAGWAADKALRYGGVNKMIAKGVTAAIDKGRELGSKALQAGKAFVGQKVQQAKAIYNSATSAVKSARQFVGQKVDQARKVVSNATRAAVQYVSQAKKQVAQTVNRAVNTVRNTVSNAVSSAKATVSNAANRVGNAISGGLKSVFGW
jgi:F0F1-type ATP synthase membrane subunit b/b'